MRNALALVTVLLVLVTSALAQPITRAPDQVPVEIIAAVEITDVAALQNHLGAFGGAVTEGGVPAPMLVPMLLMRLTKGMNSSVTDQHHPLRILVLKTGQGQCAAVSVFRVTDVEGYRATLLANLKKTETRGEITVYVQEKKQFDRKAFSKATPEERRAPKRFQKIVRKAVAIGVRDKDVCVGPEPAVVAALKLLRTGAIGTAPLLPTGDVVAFARPRAFLDLAAAEGSPFARLRSNAISTMGQAFPPGPQKERMEAIWAAELDAVEALAKQLRSASVRLDLDADQLRLLFDLRALTGTDLARYLAGVGQGPPETMRHLDADAVFAAAFKVGDWQPLVGWCVNLQKIMLATTGEGPDKAEEVAKAVQGLLRHYGDDVSFALMSGKGLRVVEVIRLKTAGSRDALVKAIPEFMEGYADMYKAMGIEMGMEVEPKAMAYKGHDISRWTIPLKLVPPKGGDANAARVQQQAMQGLFGDALILHATLIERDWVIAMGEDSVERLKAIIDGRHARLTEAAVFKKALAQFPGESQGVFYMSLPRFFSWAVGLAQAMQARDMPELHFEPGPGIMAALQASGSGVTCDLRIPTAEIRCVADGFKKAAAPQAKRSSCMANLAQIGKALSVYGADNKDILPESIEQLVPQYIANDRCFHCPRSKAEGVSYAYIGRLPAAIMREVWPGMIIAYDFKGNHTNGRNVLHYDGHAAWLAETQFRKELQDNLDQLRRAFQGKGLKLSAHLETFHADQLGP